MLPVSRCSLRKRPTELMLTSHCSAASGIVAPPSIAATTRVRKSSESGFAIHAGLLPAGSLNHIRHPMGIPRFSLFGKRSSHIWPHRRAVEDIVVYPVQVVPLVEVNPLNKVVDQFGGHHDICEVMFRL